MHSINLRVFVIGFAIPMVWLLFHILSDGAVLTPGNLVNLFKYVTVVGVLSIGMTLIIVSGHIDLSVGAGLGMMGALCAWLMHYHNLNPVLAIGVALLSAVGMGILHGSIITFFSVPSFIVTLSGLMAYTGVKQLMANPVIPILNEGYLAIGQGYLPVWFSYIVATAVTAVMAAGVWLKHKNRVRYSLSPRPARYLILMVALVAILCYGMAWVSHLDRGLPICVLLMFLVAALLHFIAVRTRFGRHLYAIGSNPEAAVYSGIRVRLHIVYVYILMGIMVTLAGIVATAQLMAGAPDIGDYQELYAIAACVIGGASLKGGQGNIWMSLLGALLMASILNGMEQVGIPSTWQKIILGLILIVAVASDKWARRIN